MIENQYIKCKGKIISIEKWIDRAKHLNRENVFQYSGKPGVYYSKISYTGPRLDVEIEIDQKTLKMQTIEVNIYMEVMELIGYERMSPKLVESITRNEGRIIDIHIAEGGSSVILDTKDFLSMNYGYR